MSAINGAVAILILAAILIVAYLLIDSSIRITSQSGDTDMHAPTESGIFAAEAYARYYHTRHPGHDAPLSYEYADMLTIGDLLSAVGADPDTDPDSICDAFESAYAEQETIGGWKFPACTCSQWSSDPDVMEHIADTAHCPAHDGDWWQDNAAREQARERADMPTTIGYVTRDEAIERCIVGPVEAGDATADEYDVDAIADEVLSYRDGHYYATEDTAKFWETVARHAY